MDFPHESEEPADRHGEIDMSVFESQFAGSDYDGIVASGDGNVDIPDDSGLEDDAATDELVQTEVNLSPAECNAMATDLEAFVADGRRYHYEFGNGVDMPPDHGYTRRVPAECLEAEGLDYEVEIQTSEEEQNTDSPLPYAVGVLASRPVSCDIDIEDAHGDRGVRHVRGEENKHFFLQFDHTIETTGAPFPSASSLTVAPPYRQPKLQDAETGEIIELPEGADHQFIDHSTPALTRDELLAIQRAVRRAKAAQSGSGDR